MYFIPSLVNSGGMERVLTEKVNFLAHTNKYNIFIVTTDMRKDQKPFFDLEKNIKLIHLEYFYYDENKRNFLEKTTRTIVLNRQYKEKVQLLCKQYLIDICITMGGKELEFLGSSNLKAVLLYESHFNKNFRSSFLAANSKNTFLWKIFGKFRDFQHHLQAKKMHKIVVLTKQSLIEWRLVTENVEQIANPSPIKPNQEISYNFEIKRAIAIGKLDNQKGFDMLIKAWKHVNITFPNWKLDIFGTGNLKEELQDLIILNNLESTINLCGQTRDIQDELLNSSFFILSSRFEGLPMVMIESITCGLPLVAFDCETGPREIIENNDCGILVKNGDIIELSNAIKLMISDKELRRKLSQSAFQKSKQYELTHIMNNWEKLFEEELKK